MATHARSRVVAAGWLCSVAALNLWAVWERLEAHHGHGWARLTVAISFALTALLLSNQAGQRRNARLFYVLTVVFTVDQLGLRDIGSLQPISMILGGWVTVLAACALLRYPGERLDPWSRVFVVCMGVVAFVLQVGLLLTGAWPWDRLGGAYLPTGLAHQRLFDAIFTIKGIWLTVAFVVLLALIVRHWRGLVRLDRRTVAPIAITALAVGVLSVVDVVDSTAQLPGQLLIGETRGYVAAALAVAFALSALRMRLAVNAIAGMLSGLAPPVTTTKVRDALGAALGDDSLDVYFWVAERDGYVDGDGRPVDGDGGDDGRRLCYDVKDGQGDPLARLVVDSALRRHERLVSAAVQVSGIVLENARLEAGLRTQLLAAQEARERLLHVGLEQRRRLERDLHDGAQQRLLGLGMRLGAIEATTDQPATAEAVQAARMELHIALDELRALAHGLYPAALKQSGLGPAIEAVAERLPIDVHLHVPKQRWHPDVESTAYLFACEALANSVKHAGPCTVELGVVQTDRELIVTVEDDGAGFELTDKRDALAGLRDRLGALGGDLSVHSGAGLGTYVEARIPCR